MNLTISPLAKGDTIAVVAPGKAIELEYIEYAIKKLTSFGYNVIIGKHVTGRFNYYSGTIEERLSDFQEALDDPNVKAVICARGGYGCVQLVDIINWSSLLRSPKWIIGFSDVTVFHQRVFKLGMKSIHATMPLNYKENSPESFETLIAALEKKQYSIQANPCEKNKTGNAEGEIVGGNLSILYSLLGTDDQIDFTDKILFIEDLSEQLYVLDRMMFAFKKAGILEKIKALVVGGITEMSDTNPPLGESIEEIILKHFQYSKKPVAFNFPIGHVNDNQAISIGSKVKLTVNVEAVQLDFIV